MNASRTTAEADRAILELDRDTVMGWESDRHAYLVVKRLQDILLSALALVVLFPLLAAVALVVVLDDPHGGPIFSQKRVGKDGKVFRMYKFRTMCRDAEAKQEQLFQYNEMVGMTFKIKNDPRITRVGKFLRRTCLDELPQLVNVLKGDMTFVGPRPALPREVAQYTPFERLRLCAAPGLTCFWQVHPERYKLNMDQWVELDIKYIRERSWLLDWMLIFRTIGTVLRANGQ